MNTSFDPMAMLAPLVAERPENAPATPKEAAKKFEELMASMLLREMHGDGEGPMGQWQDFFDTEIAKRIADSGGLGLAKVIEEQLSHGGFSAPTPPAPTHDRITSNFGWRTNPFDSTQTTFHSGLDVKGAEGTPITARRDGVVVFAGPRGGYGNLVVIDHGGGLQTRYGHCSRIDVAEGDVVQAGQNIAAVGHTGRATGPHLHLEARQDGKAIDPSFLLDPEPDPGR